MPRKKTIQSSIVPRARDVNILNRVIGISPAPLLPGEAKEDYVGFAARIVEFAKPSDPIEEFLTRDVIDLTWEVFRLRRMKAALSRASESAGVERIVSIATGPMVSHFGENWASRDAGVRDRFDNILEKYGFTTNEVMAEAFVSQIEFLERLDRILASSEARRNTALHEIERHRAALGAALRNAVEVEDAEFRDVAPGEAGGGTPA